LIEGEAEGLLAGERPGFFCNGVGAGFCGTGEGLGLAWTGAGGDFDLPSLGSGFGGALSGPAGA